MTYILPEDTPIQAIGVSPDITIKPKVTPEKETAWFKELYGKESVLKNHIPAKPGDEDTDTKKAAAEKEDELYKFRLAQDS